MDLSQAHWRKSTRSQQGPHCVEVAGNLPGVVAVRDSNDPTGPALVVPAGEWEAFVEGIRHGDYDR